MRYRKRTMRGLGADRSISDTFGGKVWEWLHPGQRASEYDLQSGAGRTVTAPDVSFGDVLDTAAQDTLDAARSAGEYGREAFKYFKIALVGGAVLYGFHLLTEWQKGRRR